MWGKTNFMKNIDCFETTEQILELRSKVLHAEQERLAGAETFSIDEVRKKLIDELQNIESSK